MVAPTRREEPTGLSGEVAVGQGAGSRAAPARIVVIEPGRWGVGAMLRSVFEYRELLFFLIWRDVKVRYKQTAIGATWAVIQPFMMMVVFTIFLGRLAKVGSSGVPYPIFAYAGLVPWTFFAQALASSSDSLVANKDLVSKVYFPRLLLPIATAGSYLLDFVLSLSVLFGLMVYYGVWPTWGIVLLPFFALLAYCTALGMGVWLTALNVRYRDVRYAVPFMLQLWLFLSPVVYPVTLLPERWRALYSLNPMAGVVEGCRWALIGTHPAPGPEILISIATVIVLLVGSVLYFRRTERTFADVV